MKKLIIILVVALSTLACTRKVNQPSQKYPDDVELFNHSKDAEIATKRPPKPPKGGGNPHNPIDTTINPPDTSTGDVCIYLDHDGEVLSGTQWNALVDGATLTLSPSGLTSTQRELIRQKVANDYKQENGFVKRIKVTDSLSVFRSYPINRRAQVIITAYHEWYPGLTGGVAYINSYTWGDGTPSFVFSKAYGYNTEYIAHASTHEPGHMFGCRHQAVYDESCNLIDSYRPGWNMGRYNGLTSIFGTGPSVCCTCMQNDIEVINSNL